MSHKGLTSASEQMCSGKDLRRLLKLLQEGSAPFEVLVLRFPVGDLLFPSELLCFFELGGQVGKVPCLSDGMREVRFEQTVAG